MKLFIDHEIIYRKGTAVSFIFTINDLGISVECIYGAYEISTSY